MPWQQQEINSNGVTAGPQTVSNPFASTYGGQEHIGYRDSGGNVWDSYYRPDTKRWSLQQINNGGVTNGPLAVAGPFIGAYNDQLHFAYLDAAGNIWDSWYDGSRWNLQKINAGGNTSGPPAMIGGAFCLVSIWVDPSGAQQHFTYLGADQIIYDAFWDSNANRWRLQKISAGGNTNGPLATSSPFACVFQSQQHIAYQGASGDIYDSWYDGSGHWSLQKINNGGNTNGPPAAASANPFVWVDPSGHQQHFTYLGADQIIHDAFWDNSDNRWHLQQITQGGLTNGPLTASVPAAGNFHKQEHVAYRDVNGTPWDSWFDGDKWNLQRLSYIAMTSVPAAFGVFVWGASQQQHFTYADAGGTIWDAFWSEPVHSTVSDGELDGDGFGDDGGDDIIGRRARVPTP